MPVEPCCFNSSSKDVHEQHARYESRAKMKMARVSLIESLQFVERLTSSVCATYLGRGGISQS